MKIKKIVTKGERAEKERKLRKWLAIFIVAIMALSTAGFALNFAQNTEKREYNGIEFEITQYGWQPKGYNIYTSYLPQDVENISFIGNFNYVDFSSKVYLISPPYIQNNLVELLRHLPIQNLQIACLEEDKELEYCNNVPIKSCDDANLDVGVIIVRESNESSAKYSNYCLEMYGDSSNLLKVSDRVLFDAYGIM